MRQRIRVGDDYAYRDEKGLLVETGWIGPEGEEHPDLTLDQSERRIDGANPAAMVPVDQKWTDA